MIMIGHVKTLFIRHIHKWWAHVKQWDRMHESEAYEALWIQAQKDWVCSPKQSHTAMI